MTRVTLICKKCSYTARRDLLAHEAGSRGTQETSAEYGACPHGHGELIRKDGYSQTYWSKWWDRKVVRKR